MKKLLALLAFLSLIFSACQPTEKILLSQLDLSKMEAGWGIVHADSSIEGNPLTVAGQTFDHGIGTHAISKMMIDLRGNAVKFHALAGVDDEAGEQASMEFFVLGDKKILWQSGRMQKGDPAKTAEVDLSGIQRLALYVSDGGDYNYYDHADWLDAWIEYRTDSPAAITQARQEAYILTPRPGDIPRINGPEIYGAGAHRDFLYKVPVTGKRPMTISAQGLPPGLAIDPSTGIIRGTSPGKGDYAVILTAENQQGKTERNFLIRIGSGLALTPPMGWNSWNCWGLSVSSEKVLSSARAMVSSGLVEHGWSYMNIDDGWEAPERASDGELPTNEKFPDMKALTGEVHAMGLKLGIYSGPGPRTCGGFLASYGHEHQDALTWAGWGIDYLKYDWCAYEEVAPDHSLPELQKPYILMRDALDKTGRDIVYSLCQYGMGDVWKWGASVGGNLWRTTGDINDSWNSMAGIGFAQDSCSPYAAPGNWNDPDMLVVGKVGWGPQLHPSRLTPDEQYTHISLWCLLASPMLIGCDLSQLDDFTLNLLTNDEVLAIDQDALGKQARMVVNSGTYQVWKKDLNDGSVAVGIFWLGSDDPVESLAWDDTPQARTIKVSWEELGLSGSKSVRDLWRQKDLGQFNGEFTTEVNFHGVTLVRMK